MAATYSNKDMRVNLAAQVVIIVERMSHVSS